MITKKTVFIRQRYEIVFDSGHCCEECELFNGYDCMEYGITKQGPNYKYKRNAECIEKHGGVNESNKGE